MSRGKNLSSFCSRNWTPRGERFYSWALGTAQGESPQEFVRRVAVVTKICSPSLPVFSFTHTHTHSSLLESGVDSLGVPTSKERGQGWLHLSMWWALVPSATGAGGSEKEARVEWEGNGCFRAVMWDSEGGWSWRWGGENGRSWEGGKGVTRNREERDEREDSSKISLLFSV